MRLHWSLILFCIPLGAQSQYFSFGLTGGGAFGRGTGSIPFGPDESKRYTFGLSFETYFTDHISVEANALYRRTGARYGIVPGSNVTILSGNDLQFISESSGQVRSHSLELPVIGLVVQRPRRPATQHQLVDPEPNRPAGRTSPSAA